MQRVFKVYLFLWPIHFSAVNAMDIGPRTVFGKPKVIERQTKEPFREKSEERQFAWRLAADLWNQHYAASEKSLAIPQWQAFYDSAEIKRLFRFLYNDLSDRNLNDMNLEKMISAEEWNTEAVGRVASWPDWRLENLLRSLYVGFNIDERRVRGLAGVSKVLTNGKGFTSLMFHLKNCRNGYRCSEVNFASSSIWVKAAWRRIDGESTFAHFPTNQRTLMSLNQSDTSNWQDVLEFTEIPTPDKIFTVQTASGSRFALVGMHIMSKVLKDWLWVTLWWSNEPDSDFGADRPQSLQEKSVLTNYKLCSVSTFERLPHGRVAKSLELASDEAHSSSLGASWCSNPYIEQGEHNAKTNCIGCHQHAGTKVKQSEILENLETLGLLRNREDFPSDYVWSLGGPAGGLLDDIVGEL
ncbi:MAG: hypothetical protein COT74_01360 [Bdellovibrionales bacterium CG10_big_fil_rev_8_21_14_0_10_45_34]|nr:MAG: hypothetical protein COT74_01360 [Bdellovibrionales bacterium CG10_big_fil_rev_8_21_14_0_10_45_34]